MCGIAGIIASHAEPDFETQVIAATECLHHRGPECNCAWKNADHTAILGHSRLSIIDLSEKANQPFHYADRFTIVHNGELYNYKELKSELTDKGFHFATSSDTEVIVASYAAWGRNCVERFDGMFAFAIWDENDKELFAARDRFGEKPFFFSYANSQLRFASEMKALWKMGVSKEVNQGMLYNFLTIGYTSNPGDPSETFYQHIEKLPAASFLLFSPLKNELKIERYWQLDVEETVNIPDGEAIEKFEKLLKESVQRRLRSDVSIGTSLSGGLDSSTIVALCQQFSSDQYSHKCFTAVFPGYEKNEEAHAKMVADMFGLEQHLVTIDPAEVPSLMQKVMRHQEEPVGSGSALAQYKVFETAKASGVTVLLDGQGADETIGGYSKYYKWYWQELYKNKRLAQSKELSDARNIGIKERFGISNKIAALFPDLAGAFLQSKKARSINRDPEFDKEFSFRHKRESYYSLPAHFTLNGVLHYNTVVNGLEELLRMADRNSMAHSLEVRLPFLSHELVEFGFSLPPEFKIRNGWTKWLLRKTSEKYLPKEISWRKDKVGFEPPQKLWTAQKHVQEAIMHGKEVLVKNNILNPSSLKNKIQPHEAFASVHNDWKYWSASFLFE
jgi:asparagine synthase (glutamine-hydrolysing)